MIDPAFEILNQRGTPMFFSDVFANRPNAGIVGRIFISTDTAAIYRDTGTTWDLIADGGSASVNIYNSNGTLTGNRVVSYNSNYLSFTGGQTFFGSQTTSTGLVVINNASSDAHLQVVGANAPSIRIDNAGFGATRRFVMGLATATNNFIQGATAGDICISTASSSPLLFGMWQSINASEVMRITTSNNISIGYNVDLGYKLYVNGAIGTNGAITIGNGGSGTSYLYALSGSDLILNAGGDRITIRQTGNVIINNLSGSGTRMVVADASGVLSTQAVPSGTISGSGTTSYVPKFTGSSTIGDSNLYSDSSGNLCIGSTSAGSTSAALSLSIGVPATTSGGLQLWAATNQTHYVQFGDGTTGGDPYRGYVGYTQTNDALLFGTASTERGRFSSAGNLLLGTQTDSGYKLDVNGSGAFRASGTLNMFVSDNSNWSFIQNTGTNSATNNLGFFVSGATADLFINTAGKIGIATISPLSALDVRAANAVNGSYQTIQAFTTNSAAIDLGAGISLGGNYSGTSSIAQFGSIWGRKENSTSGNYDGYLAFGTNSQSTGVREVMRITSSGNLGIGNSSPSAKLDIIGTSSDQIRLRTASSEYYAIGRNSSTGYLDFYGSQSGYVGYLWTGVNGNRMLLNESGNLGLGVTPSQWGAGIKALQIGSTTSIYNTGQDTYIGENIYVDGAYNNRYLSSTFATLYRQITGYHIWYAASSGTAGGIITFTQAMTLAASGNLLIGTTTDSGIKLDVNGTGIFRGQLETTSNLITSGYINSNNYIRITGGSDTGSQLVMWANSSGNTFLAGYDFQINTGSNNSRSASLYIGPTGSAIFYSGVEINGQFKVDGQTSGTAGGSSGQHLIINCDGTTYKIALLNN